MLLLPNAEPFVQFQENKDESYSQLLSESFCNGHSSLPLKEVPLVQKKKIIQIDQETQTIQSSSSIDRQMFLNRIRQLESENKDLKLQIEERDAALESFRKIFTEVQIRKMMSPGNIKWRWGDISNAIYLHAAGPRAYNHLYVKGFPLPHKSTLQRWCAKIPMTDGVLKNSIEFMRQTSNLTLEDKICVLAFDEMKVAECFDYDSVNDTVQE